jgi:hypothetical protein
MMETFHVDGTGGNAVECLQEPTPNFHSRRMMDVLFQPRLVFPFAVRREPVRS